MIVYCEFMMGSYEGVEVILFKLGIGKVNVVISMMFLFDCFKFDYVINIGLVGGFYYILNVGDVVILIDVSYYDVDVMVFDYEYGQVFGFLAVYKVDEKLISIIEEVVFELNGI